MKPRDLLILALLPLFIAAAPKRPLDKRVAELNFHQQPLSDALESLRLLSGANMYVNWKALELVDVDKTTPVDLQLTNISMRTAIEELLSQAAPDGRLTYFVRDGIIVITTLEQADKQMITRVYDVQDLLMEIPDFTQLPQTPQQNSQSVTPGTGGSSSSFSTQQQQQTNTQLRTRADRETDLVKLIETTIRPEVWKDNGGSATITMYKGHLIITAPRSVHAQISGLRD